MGTTLLAYEFRCTHCYHVVQLATDLAGQQVHCPCCASLIEAPPATEDRMCNVSATTAAPHSDSSSMAPPIARQSIDELKEAAKQRAKSTPRTTHCSRPDRMSTSRLSRLAAFLIDMFGFAFAQGLGVIPVMMLDMSGVVNRPTVEAYTRFMCLDVPIAAITRDWSTVQRAMAGFSPELWMVLAAMNSVLILFLIGQAYGVSTNGQSLGKRVMRIKIVNSTGEPPGFVSGVLIRSCVINVLVILPCFVLDSWPAFFLQLFCLANLAAICLEPPRCIHDRLAGTYVISV